MSKSPLARSAGWLALTLCAPLGAQQYSITEIPQMTHASGVNRHGVVVGNNLFYVHSSGVVNTLPTIAANGINDLGQIAASTPAPPFAPQAAVLFVTGGSQLLGNRLLSVATAISDSGFAVGIDADFHRRSHANLWQLQSPATTIDLEQLPTDAPRGFFDPESFANAVNDQGVAVGSSEFAVLDSQGLLISEPTHAVRWANGTVTDLGTLPGGTNSSANGINDREEIVGSSETAEGATHAFLIRRQKILDLGNLAGHPPLDSAAEAINDEGEIVGSSQARLPDNSLAQRAFVYRHGRMRDLTALIDPHSPLRGTVTLTDAPAISCNGWIAANGFDNVTLAKHAYILIPRDRDDGDRDDRDRDDKSCR